MNKFTRISTRLSVSLALSILVGCATNSSKSPVANSVCIDAPLRTSYETGQIRRMASKYLHDRGFNLADSACDVSVRFHPFDDVSANLVVRPGGDWNGSSSVEGSLSLEGTLDVVYQERPIVQGQVVALHSRDSVQTLLDRLAWAMVEPVVTRFSPPSASRGN